MSSASDFEIASNAQGELHGTMLSVNQGNTRSTIFKIENKDGNVRLEIKQGGSAFEGEISAGGSQLSGKWKQSGLSLPLVMTRSKETSPLSRPQEPKKPYPYEEVEVAVPNKTANIKLAT